MVAAEAKKNKIFNGAERKASLRWLFTKTNSLPAGRQKTPALANL